jgi:hypothetical protein
MYWKNRDTYWFNNLKEATIPHLKNGPATKIRHSLQSWLRGKDNVI